MGRRRLAQMPRQRPEGMGCGRDLHHRQQQAAVQELLQNLGAADGVRELRRSQRVADPDSRPRRDGAGLVSGRDFGDWYQGGISVFDWTDAAHPKEIAYFDRGPIDSTHMASGGVWSVYWYNGAMFSSEIARGMDITELVPSEF